jgi:hypothetical protein
MQLGRTPPREVILAVDQLGRQVSGGYGTLADDG